MKDIIKILYVFSITMMYSCTTISESIDEKYQQIAPAVLTANGILEVKYAEDSNIVVDGTIYKNYLKEDYKASYETLIDYDIQVKMDETNFIIYVYDDDLLILKDWLCTSNRIDCWPYKDNYDSTVCAPECN